MKVLWITFSDIKKINGKITSTAASARYRMITPARELQAHNVVSFFQGIPAQGAFETGPVIDAIDSDIVIFSKSFNPGNEIVASEIKKKGIHIIFDICDSHFSTPDAEHHKRMIDLADTVTTSTQKLAEIIEEHCNKRPVVIGDPYEGTEALTRFAPGARIKLLWFGHQQNIGMISDTIPELQQLATTHPLHLTLVTGNLPQLEQKLEQLNQINAPHMTFSYIPWSVDATEKALSECDIVLLPSSKDEYHQAKSPNRLIEAVRAGKFAIAHPIPSYEEFAPYSYISDSLAEGIQWALENSEEVENRINAGKKFIQENYSPQNIAQQWLATFQDVLSKPVSQPENRPDQPVRLNLGCGDKILHGYVNVDIAPSRRGNKPDVLCDLRNLEPFSDHYADEILSVHVIEHIDRWEVPDILSEWFRVLKPGGKLILECPNLITACQEFIKDPDNQAGSENFDQRTMWVLYGDPNWKDPLMMHRWGYTPNSLSKIMEEAGLVNVRQEPAQFKLREPRDMRIVGEKPHSENPAEK